jgi:hypothetical protein
LPSTVTSMQSRLTYCGPPTTLTPVQTGGMRGSWSQTLNRVVSICRHPGTRFGAILLRRASAVPFSEFLSFSQGIVVPPLCVQSPRNRRPWLPWAEPGFRLENYPRPRNSWGICVAVPHESSDSGLVASGRRDKNLRDNSGWCGATRVFQAHQNPFGNGRAVLGKAALFDLRKRLAQESGGCPSA